MGALVELPGKVPPQSLEAERAVLGCILIEPSVLPRAIELVQPEDFYKEGHRKIFGAMLRLFERSEPADTLTVAEELRRAGALEEVGGQATLATLMEEATVATQFGSYATLVREKALLRDLIRVTREISEEGFEQGEDVQALLDRAEQTLFRLSERRLRHSAVPVRDLVGPTIHHIEILHQRKEDITGLPTGFKKLNEMTAGFQRSDFIILAGRPSTGKTALALNIAEHVAVYAKKPVLIFSLEMSAAQLVHRLLCAAARVNSKDVRTGHFQSGEWGRLNDAASRLYEAPMYIDDSANLSVLEVRAKARRLKHEHGLELVVVDYLQLMQGRFRSENRQQEISEISRSLKALAKDLNLPVLALSQLSRAAEARGDGSPRLSDLRESGALEQDADLIMFLAKKETAPDEDPGTVDLLIGKHRNGPTGKIELVFKKEYTRFETLSTRDQL